MSKVCIVWAKKVQRSYLSWHWKMIQNLKKNWLVTWKMIWGILQIFTRELESIKIRTLIRPFVQNRKCMSFKFTVEVCVMAMKNDTKIEEELTCRFKIDIKVRTEHSKSLRIFLIGSLWPKYILFEPLKYWGVVFHETEEICKFWRKTDIDLKKYMRNLANFHQSTWKCQNWDFHGILLSKVEKVWP